jgi:hypothetical protein
MEEIKRTGPPKASTEEQHGNIGNMHLWAVTLSSLPSDRWLSAFKNPGSSTAVIHPGLLRFERGLLFFRSDEKDVPEWVNTLDQWIDNANKVTATHAEQEGRRLAEQSARHQAETQRIEKMNEKFKNL